MLGGCSATRDLADDELMLDKVKVVADGKYKDISTSQLKSYVRQKGNARWFSSMKIPLGVYAMAGQLVDQPHAEADGRGTGGVRHTDGAPDV